MLRTVLLLVLWGSVPVSAQSHARTAACGAQTDAECLRHLGTQTRGSRELRARRFEVISELVDERFVTDWLRLALLQHDTAALRAMLPEARGCYTHPVEAFNRVPRGEVVWARPGMMVLVDGDKLNLLVGRDDGVERCEVNRAIGTRYHVDDPRIQTTSLGDEGMLLAVPTRHIQTGTGGETTREIMTLYWIGPRETTRVIEIPTLLRDSWTGGCESGVGRCETNERSLRWELRDGALHVARTRTRGERGRFPTRNCMARMVQGTGVSTDWGAPVCLAPGAYVMRMGALVRR